MRILNFFVEFSKVILAPFFSLCSTGLGLDWICVLDHVYGGLKSFDGGSDEVCVFLS